MWVKQGFPPFLEDVFCLTCLSSSLFPTLPSTLHRPRTSNCSFSCSVHYCKNFEYCNLSIMLSKSFSVSPPLYAALKATWKPSLVGKMPSFFPTSSSAKKFMTSLLFLWLPVQRLWYYCKWPPSSSFRHAGLISHPDHQLEPSAIFGRKSAECWWLCGPAGSVNGNSSCTNSGYFQTP